MTAAFTVKTRAIVHTRDGWCVGCGSHSSLTLQHRKSRGMGSTKADDVRSPANALLLCGSGTTGCHGWAERNPTAAGFLGWRVAQWEDPTKVPCWRGTSSVDGAWYLLDDNGDVTPASDHVIVSQASMYALELVRSAA